MRQKLKLYVRLDIVGFLDLVILKVIHGGPVPGVPDLIQLHPKSISLMLLEAKEVNYMEII